MKQVKLLETAQIPDENHEGEGPVPSATNYRGAVLNLSDWLADQLVAEGKAEYHAPNTPPESGTRPGPETMSGPGAADAGPLED